MIFMIYAEVFMITMTASTMITMARPNILSARVRASTLPFFVELLYLYLADM